MGAALRFIKKEFLEMLPPTVYFFLVLHLLVFARALMNETGPIQIELLGAATIGALIVGKSILIADALPLFHWFGGVKLLYNIIWRVFLYMLIILVFQVLEELIPQISKYDDLGVALEHAIEEIQWHHFWATHIILTVFLAIYALVTAIIDGIGRDTYWGMLLGPKR